MSKAPGGTAPRGALTALLLLAALLALLGGGEREGGGCGPPRTTEAMGHSNSSRGALKEVSWELLARIWQEIADCILKIAFWEASWELLARIWQEI